MRNIQGYYVKGCKIDYKTIFSGYVLNIHNESIIDSIKRKVGRNELLCELTSEGFDYDKVSVFSIPITELTVGDIMIINGRYDDKFWPL